MTTNHRIPSERTLNVRELNEEEREKLKSQNSRMITPFMAQKLEIDARKNWDLFYKRNKTNFFKDRHWTTSEFKELLGNENTVNQCLLEVGCGVGNLVFPLLDESTLKIYACDFSERAIDLIRQDPKASKLTAFVADVTSTDLALALNGVEMNIVTMVFVLSAIHPDKLLSSVRNVYNCMSKDGVVLFRDYAVNDMTEIRFKAGHKIGEHFYMRQDGTRTYFFTIENIENVFESAGFVKEECCYVHCKTVNKKEGIDAPRTFVQAKFRK